MAGYPEWASELIGATAMARRQCPPGLSTTGLSDCVPLKAPARARLAETLGDVELLDIRQAVFGADLVLAPSCSPQCVAVLKRAYPTARLVVVELDDWDFNVSLPGPVKRALNAGADAYLLADSIEQLAQQFQPRPRASAGSRRQAH